MAMKCAIRSLQFRPGILLAVICFAGWSMPVFGQSSSALRKVTYQTADGWTIHGTYFPPDGKLSGPVPGVIVLSEPGWVIRMIHYGNIAEFTRNRGMAVLVIDMRGSGASYGKKDFERFSPDEIDAMQLDIEGAVKFLGSQPGVDPQRIGIVAAGVTAEYAVRAAAKRADVVQALVLITGSYSQKSLDFIRSRADLPVCSIAGRGDRKDVQEQAAAPYFQSGNVNSQLLFVMDRGAYIFNRPGEVREKVSGWLAETLVSLGTDTPVSFKSEDGVTLRGNLLLPQTQQNAKVPGVVFVHGINHDQQTWYYLAREVVKRGQAALVFDWRGVRKSTNEDGSGEFRVDLPADMSSKIYLDVKAAINFLAAQSAVDANRMALVAATATNNHAVRAMMGDNRIKTFVGLSFYAPDPDVKEFLPTLDVPFFLVASSIDSNADGGSLAAGTREVYQLLNNKQTELIMYEDDAGRGSDILKVKSEMSPMIVRWLQEKLGM